MSKLDKWNDETTCRFVVLYRQQRCLWDVRSWDYKNKRARDEAIEEIADKMAIDGFRANEIKNKIRSLRSTYYLEMKKINQSKANPGKAIYKPTLKWFYIMQEIMSSLGKDMTRKKKKTEIEDWRTDNQNEGGQDKEPEDEEDDTSSVERDPIKTELVLSEEDVLTIEETPPKRRRFHDRDEQEPDVMVRIEELKDLVASSSDHDECTLFGRYVGSQLKKMTYATRTICQLNIQKLMSEALLNEMHDNQGSSIRVDIVHTRKE